MISINPYLNFAGNTEEAFNFYKSVFGGEFTTFQRFKDMPSEATEEKEMVKGNEDKIMHVSLPIGKNNVLMGSDSMGWDGKPLVVGDNFNLSINTESEEQAHELFDKLSKGGRVEMALGKVPWGGIYGMLVDKFNIWWMISFNPDQK